MSRINSKQTRQHKENKRKTACIAYQQEVEPCAPKDWAFHDSRVTPAMKFPVNVSLSGKTEHTADFPASTLNWLLNCTSILCQNRMSLIRGKLTFTQKLGKENSMYLLPTRGEPGAPKLWTFPTSHVICLMKSPINPSRTVCNARRHVRRHSGSNLHDQPELFSCHRWYISMLTKRRLNWSQLKQKYCTYQIQTCSSHYFFLYLIK